MAKELLMARRRKSSHRGRGRGRAAKQAPRTPPKAEPDVTAQPRPDEPPKALAPEAEISFEHFWPQVLRAVGCEPKNLESIRGASGVPHRLIAAGVDETQRRLIVVSAEPDARSAALAQADLQAAMEDTRVLVARPILVSAQDFALELARITGRATITVKDLERLPQGSQEEINVTLEPQIQPLMELMSGWIRNASGLKTFRFLEGVRQALDQLARIQWREEQGVPGADLTRLFGTNPEAEDLQLGICGFPLFAFSGTEMESVHGATDPGEVREILRRRNVLQFFFPPPDQVALGLVDRGAETSEVVEAEVSVAPNLGHPLGPNELVGTDVSLPDLIDALKELGLVAHGEISLEVTPDGRSVRQTIQFAPREGVVSKLVNRININIDLKDVFRAGGIG